MPTATSPQPRLVLVSDRLPVSVRRSGSERVLERTRGGMVAGLGPMHAASDSLWIGSLEAQDVKRFGPQLAAQRLVPVTNLGLADSRRHYDGMCNQVLWPLCHYLLGHVAFTSADYAAYARVNQRYAEVVAEHVRPGDLVWVHDYHLMLLPQLLRQRFPELAIGFFLHIPFPSAEIWRILPRQAQLLAGLMGANLIGVHTYDYGRHLIDSCQRILGAEFDDDWVRRSDGACRVGVFPLGIDVAQHHQLATRPGVQRRVERLQRQVLDRQVILGVDRMDYTKGLPERLDGFRHLLETAPHWRERATLWQLAMPTRSTIASYRDLKAQVERRVGEINGAYQTGGLSPISYMYRNVSPEQLMALYRLAPVALITPTRDGMNLVAKEYVASRTDNTGVLVLSAFAGAAAELGEALLVNPQDPESITQALERALTMSPSEQAMRMAALRRRVAAHTVQDWVARFIETLTTCHHQAQATARRPADLSQVAPQLAATPAAFAAARRPLLVLDLDASMPDLEAGAEAAQPSPELRQLLARLGGLPGVRVLLLSGRAPLALGAALGDLPVSLIAEHGFHGRAPGQPDWQRLTPAPDLSWQARVGPILAHSCDRAPGAYVEHKPLSLAWHYRQTELGFGQFLARALAEELAPLADLAGFSLMAGPALLEVRPQGTDKGTALRQFIAAQGPFDCLLALSDNPSGEALLAALPAAAWAVRLGPVAGSTRAQAILPSIRHGLSWLQQLAAARQG